MCVSVCIYTNISGRKTENYLGPLFLMDKEIRSHAMWLLKEGFFVKTSVWQLSWENKKSRSCHCTCCKGKLRVSKSFLIQTGDKKSDTLNSEGFTKDLSKKAAGGEVTRMKKLAGFTSTHSSFFQRNKQAPFKILGRHLISLPPPRSCSYQHTLCRKSIHWILVEFPQKGPNMLMTWPEQHKRKKQFGVIVDRLEVDVR